MRAAVLVTAASIVVACATPVRVEVHPSERRVERIALLPLLSASSLQQAGPSHGNGTPKASMLVTARVLEALVRGDRFDVIPPAEGERALRHAGIDPHKAEPAEVAAALTRAFGVDGVLSGTVRRFRARQGSRGGATSPAAVRFDLALHDAQGVLLFRGEYDETQRSLADDVRSLRRAAQRRFRWVSAEELAAYGARELVGSLEDGRSSWR